MSARFRHSLSTLALAVSHAAGAAVAEPPDSVGEALSAGLEHVSAAPAAPAQAPAVTPPAPAAGAPAAPSTSQLSGLGPPPASASTPPRAPIMVDQTGVTGGDPQSYSDIAYDSRIRESVAAAQGLQGPMDGRWTLVDGAGKPLYVFMFVDPAGGRGPLEAAWRDPRRVRGGDDLGVVDGLDRNGLSLTLTFAPHAGAAPTQVQLQGDPAGALSGQMSENGATVPVTLRRP